MINKVYSTPLHGVECSERVYNKDSKPLSSLPHGVQVAYEKILVPPTASPIWSLNDFGERYSTQLYLYKLSNDEFILDVKCEGAGRFYITPNKIAIDWQAGGTDAAHYFQTLAISLYLELKGVVCIHANALVAKNKDARCFALIAPSGMGKSTLSAYMQSKGYTWLTDDMLALHQSAHVQGKTAHTFSVYPSWPKARLWPDSVKAVRHESADKLKKVHNKFNKVELAIHAAKPEIAYPLDGIFVLSRHGAKLAAIKQNAKLREQAHFAYMQNEVNTGEKVSICKVNSSKALMALLQNSMLGSAYASLGLEQARLIQLSNLVSRVPVMQICYSSNYDDLAQVLEQIEKTDISLHASKIN